MTYVTRRMLDRAFHTIGKWVGSKLKPLEDRIAALEARPALRHAGVWAEGKKYHEANLATHAGGMWLAQKDTSAKPGTSDDWQLVVKSGHAGNGADRKRIRTGARQ